MKWIQRRNSVQNRVIKCKMTFCAGYFCIQNWILWKKLYDKSWKKSSNKANWYAPPCNFMFKADKHALEQNTGMHASTCADNADALLCDIRKSSILRCRYDYLTFSYHEFQTTFCLLKFHVIYRTHDKMLHRAWQLKLQQISLVVNS